MHLGARSSRRNNAVEIQEVMRGIRRPLTRGVVKKEAAVDEQIKRMVDTCDPATYQGANAIARFFYSGSPGRCGVPSSSRSMSRI